MFINFNEHFKVNPPKYIELETLLSNLHQQTMFCCFFHTIWVLNSLKIDVQTFEVRNIFMEFP